VTISGMGKCRVKRSFFSRAGGFQLTHALVYCAVLLLLAGPGHVAAKALRVAVVSDLNGSYGSTRYDASVDAAVKRIVALRPDLVISTGDMVGGQRKPHLSQPEVEAMWRSFHAHVSDPIAAAGIPLAATPGNHDGSAYAGFETERRIYAEQWGARKPALRYIDDAHYPFYYAFAAGDGLFISLDATTVGQGTAVNTCSASFSAMCPFGPTPRDARPNTSATRSWNGCCSRPRSTSISAVTTTPFTRDTRTGCTTSARPASARAHAS